MEVIDTHHAVCRVCINACGLEVTTTDGRVTQVTGDVRHPVHAGYTCTKGRAQPHYLNSPDRILRPLRRGPNGWHEVSSAGAIDEIAARLAAIVAEHGPRAVASYVGTYRDVLTNYVMEAFMEGLGSPMRFDPNTIDKPGKLIALALHGAWQAPAMNFQEAGAALVIGANPLVGHTGFPHTNPVKWLEGARAGGMKLIVIDPRRTETARRADLFIQPRPGEDDAIVAAMLRVIIDEQLYDEEFVAAEVSGLECLRRAVDPFDVHAVARRADVSAADLVSAARMFATAGRGFAFAGTGSNMSVPGSLLEYLVLAMHSLCGYWMREGEVVRNAPALLPCPSPRAQATSPVPVTAGVDVHSRDLKTTTAGLPTSGMPDDILSQEPDRIRALLVTGGNPVGGWPDQLRVIESMKALDLLVVVDPWRTATTEYADFVLPPTMPLEMASSTQGLDGRTMFPMTGYGVVESFAQLSPAVVDVPADSDVLEDWQWIRGIGARMGLPMSIPRPAFTGLPPIALTESVASTDLMEALSAGSRARVDEVASHPSGVIVTSPEITVAGKEPGWTGRLDVGSRDVLADLEDVMARESAGVHEFPFRLVSRRLRHVFNSTGNMDPAHRGKAYNPAFMHPADLDVLGLVDGDEVVLESSRASIPAIVEADVTLRRGLISMAHSFGASPTRDVDVRSIGSNTGRLIDVDLDFDRFSGQPRMSNIPVRLRPTTTPNHTGRSPVVPRGES